MIRALHHIRFGYAVLSLGLGLACSSAGNFANKTGKRDERPGAAKPEATEKAENAGQSPQAAPTVSDPDASPSDQADRPAQITGTYLTCGNVEAPADGHAVVGCRLARTSTEETVGLATVATKWAWDFAVPSGTSGATRVAEQPVGSEWQVHYEMTASSLGELERLIGALKVVLDLVLRPESGGSDLPMPLSELLAVLLGGGSDTIVPPASAVGSSPSSPMTLPATPEAARVAPIVFFKLVPQSGDKFALQLALNDATDVTNVEVTGGGAVAFKSAAIEAGGQASVDWSVPLFVSLKQAGKTCKGNGDIGPSTLQVATFCE